MDHHPVADLFPMLADDELAELADDIKQRGLLQPIVLDADGRVLDGRNRLAACERAGVEPEFTKYDGDDPDGYALSVNIQRRNLTKGQAAMVAAQAVQFLDSASVRTLAVQNSISKSRVSQASVVLEFAPDLVSAVIAGATGLDKAYEVARDRKTAADSDEAQLARLRAEDPELADKVVEGELSLAGAQAERKSRAAEKARQHKVSTHLLCEVVPSLAQTQGTITFAQYDPGEALPGRAVTRQVVERAQAALVELAEALKSRDLP